MVDKVDDLLLNGEQRELEYDGGFDQRQDRGSGMEEMDQMDDLMQIDTT